MRDATLELREPKPTTRARKCRARRAASTSMRRSTPAAERITRARCVSRARAPSHLRSSVRSTRCAGTRCTGTRGAVSVARAGELFRRHAGRAHPRGGARNFDARIYALDVSRTSRRSYHVEPAARHRRRARSRAGAPAPVEASRPAASWSTTRSSCEHFDASLAGIPLHVTGGIYDFTGDLTGAAQLRLGDLRHAAISPRCASAFAFTRSEPISGGIDLGVLVQGRSTIR